MIPKEKCTCGTHGIPTCSMPEGSSTQALFVLWIQEAVGSEHGTNSREHTHQLVKCSSGLVAYAGIELWPFKGLHVAHERILKCCLSWRWAVHMEALVKLNSSLKTPPNLLLAICHIWVLASKLNLQLIYNDLNSKNSSCTWISDAFPLGSSSPLEFLKCFL